MKELPRRPPLGEGTLGRQLPVPSGSEAAEAGRDLGIEIVDAVGKVLIGKGVFDIGSGGVVLAGSITVTGVATVGKRKSRGFIYIPSL